MSRLFLYDVESESEANPPHRKDAFDDSLKNFFRGAGLRYIMGALGGMRHTSGAVWRETGELTQQDRDAVAEFIRRQPIRAVARIGDLEADSPTTDFLRPIMEWVFEVDGLSDADRAEAAAWHDHMRGLVARSASRRPAEHDGASS